MASIASAFPSAIPQSIAELPHYKTNVRKELPANAAPMGVLADGSIYFNAYEMLTADDVSLLKKVTGRSFDSATVRAEQTAGTFQGDALAAAIGFDRADWILDSILHGGLSGDGLSGKVDASYIRSIEKALSDPSSSGMYEGTRMSLRELESALSFLTDEDEPAVNVSA